MPAEKLPLNTLNIKCLFAHEWKTYSVPESDAYKTGMRLWVPHCGKKKWFCNNHYSSNAAAEKQSAEHGAKWSGVPVRQLHCQKLCFGAMETGTLFHLASVFILYVVFYKFIAPSSFTSRAGWQCGHLKIWHHSVLCLLSSFFHNYVLPNEKHEKQQTASNLIFIPFYRDLIHC